MRSLLRHIWREQRGATAVEFAIVSPVFIAMVVGLLALCLCLFLVGSLHYSVEEAARCASVRTTVCKDAGTTIAYAQSRYFGPSTPTFNYAAAACGNSVTGVDQLRRATRPGADHRPRFRFGLLPLEHVFSAAGPTALARPPAFRHRLHRLRHSSTHLARCA